MMPEMVSRSRPEGSVILTGAALALFLAGLALLFAPAEIATALALESSPVMAQLLAAAMLGLAAGDWIARGSATGGIYGRAIVTVNSTSFAIAALVLARAWAGAPSLALLLATAVVSIFAVAFLFLLRSKGLPPG